MSYPPLPGPNTKTAGTFDRAEPRLPMSATFLVAIVGQRVHRRLEQELEVHGLSLRMLGALGHLSANPEASYSELARRAGLTTQSMHATVRLLERDGAVTRAPGGRGRRAQLRVSDYGHELLRLAGRVAWKLDTELMGGASDVDRASLTQPLMKIAAALGTRPPRP